MDSKEHLISQLAASFGMGSAGSTKYSDSKFDPATGTLYCEGITIPRATMVRALDYFERQKEYYRKLSQTDPNIMDNYLFACVAYNAISMLMVEIKK